jgi:NitT/TauT family transport system substrate-binding protein
MLKISRRGLAALAAFAFAVAAFAAPQARAQDKPTIKVSSLTIPVFSPIVWNILKAQHFDTKNGFNLELHPYPSISAYYAAFATGETDALFGGPTILQKLYLEGVPVRMIGTGLKLSDLVIFASNPAIKSLADLKGKQLAIDMGGSQYQMVKIYASAKGIELGKDITTVQANFPTARAQLEAGRVDAALVIEPLASLILKTHPDWKIIFNGADGWREITGEDGWEIVPAIRADAIQKMPDAPKKLLAALQDVADFIGKDTAAADKIANETTKLPPGVLKTAVDAKRWEFVVRPATGNDRKVLIDMMQRAVKAGFYTKMPDEKIIYAP